MGLILSYRGKNRGKKLVTVPFLLEADNFDSLDDLDKLDSEEKLDSIIYCTLEAWDKYNSLLLPRSGVNYDLSPTDS